MDDSNFFCKQISFFKTLTDNFHWLHLHPVTCTFPHPLKYFRIRIPLECGERYDPSIKSKLVSPQVTLNTIISPQIVTDMGIASDTVVESIQAVLPASVTMIVWADVTTQILLFSMPPPTWSLSR